jgi:hypothetical protein
VPRRCRAHSVALGSRSLRWGVKKGGVFRLPLLFVEIVHEHTRTRCTLVQGDKTHLSEGSPTAHISEGFEPATQPPS